MAGNFDDKNLGFSHEDGDTDLTRRLGVNSDFFPDDIELERLVEGVNREIDRQTEDKVTSVPWIKNLASVAAAMVLVFGIFFYGGRTNLTDGLSGVGIAVSDLYYDNSEGTVIASLTDDEVDAFDDTEIDLLLYDYSNAGYGRAGAGLLDDLTSEELEYLETSFDIGDIL